MPWENCGSRFGLRIFANALGSGGGEPADRDALPVLLRVLEIVLHLLCQPTLGAATERLGQPDRHLGGDAEAAVEQH